MVNIIADDSCQSTRVSQRLQLKQFGAVRIDFDFFLHISSAKFIEMEVERDAENRIPETVQARFVSDDGEEAGPPLELPTIVTVSQLGRICNAILQNVCVESTSIEF